MADALQHHYQTDIALINGGAIRSDKIYAAQSALTTKDILSALPFTNKAVVVKLSGKQVLEILQHGVAQVEKYSGRFPQIAGFEFEYSPQLMAGQQISNVKINHQAVNLEKIYTMATIDYLFQGGDGYETFKQTQASFDIEQGELFSNIVINYLSNLKQIKAVDMGRITVVNNSN